jgi:adenylate cyclase
MNLTAYCVTAFTLVYALQQLPAYAIWKPVMAINLCLAVVALSVPFLHRFGPMAGVLTLGIAESIGLFALTACLGREAGLQVQFIAAVCVYFVVLGLERMRLIAFLTCMSFALHILAWALFPQEHALLAVSRADLSALYITAMGTTFSIVAVVLHYAFRLAERAQAESDALLHNILPAPIVERLKRAPKATIADAFGEGTVLFADLKGFVPLTRRLGPVQSVALLNVIMSAFDALADRFGVEKIKTIGDAYMIACGAPEPRADHAERTARMALSMHERLAEIATAHGLSLALRIGIASGPVMGGVIGNKRLTYDVWGDTVNLASRLEGLSRPGAILVSHETRTRLGPGFLFEHGGAVEVKGYGTEETWFLAGARELGSADTAVLAQQQIA